MSRLIIALVCTSGLSACSSIGPLGDIADSIPTNLTLSCKADPAPAQRTSSTLSGYPATTIVTLPPELAQDKVASALVAAIDHVSEPEPALRSGQATFVYEQKTPFEMEEFSAGDFEDFISAFSSSALTGKMHLNDRSGPTLRTSAVEIQSMALFREYYRHYIRGEFVTRFGKKLAKPDISQGVDNATLDAVLTIFLEALGDLKFKTPVIKSEKEGKPFYFPGQSKLEPTAAKLMIIDVVDVATETNVCGVTEKEAEAISWLASLAEDKSSIVSAMAIESLGGLELSFVIGGHFSIGDNKTLASVVKTFIGTSSRYIAEYGSYKLFWHAAYELDPAPRSGFPAWTSGAGPAVQIVASDGKVPGGVENKARVEGLAVFLSGFE
ncbi:MAG: hypothetical protein RIC36_17105 [Rhodospirillales bacterium]